MTITITGRAIVIFLTVVLVLFVASVLLASVGGGHPNHGKVTTIYRR